MPISEVEESSLEDLEDSNRNELLGTKDMEIALVRPSVGIDLNTTGTCPNQILRDDNGCSVLNIDSL